MSTQKAARGSRKQVEDMHDTLLDIRVAVWDAINLVPQVHSPQAAKRLRYAIKKLNLLVDETRFELLDRKARP